MPSVIGVFGQNPKAAWRRIDVNFLSDKLASLSTSESQTSDDFVPRLALIVPKFRLVEKEMILVGRVTGFGTAQAGASPFRNCCKSSGKGAE